jgi:MFS family permease
VPPADYDSYGALADSYGAPADSYGAPADSYGAPTYHHGARPGGTGAPSRPAVALTKAAAVRTHQAARVVTRKVISASKSDGAEESGLTALIWNQVLSYGTDAMITVALAGTVFFGASTHAQRGNVLLYLLITMAPFAVVAPVIGPALDRLQHGRRWTMAGTAIGRAVLALIMAAHPTDLLVLYPCALGSLVLSKAYAVVRAAAAPRLVPEGMTLTSANARLSIFGLGSTLVLGGAIGIVIKITGSYSMGLWITAIGFAVCAFFAFRLPAQVDSAPDATRQARAQARAGPRVRVAKLDRLRSWATRGFNPYLVIALQGECALRLLSGLLTIYLAFYVESTTHGLAAAAQLGAVIGAAGVGNFAGTAIGTKLRMARPEYVIVASVAIAAAVCIIAAIVFSILFAVLGMFVSAVGNALSKIALDALIQRDVRERLRSSAFARSETFLQLAWVVGAAIGVLLPSKSQIGGAIGFWVAGAVMGVVAVLVLLRVRVQRRSEPRDAEPPAHPGSVDMRKIQPS